MASMLPKTVDARHVVSHWLARARQSGTPDVYTDKRQDARYTWAACLEVMVVDRSGRQSRFFATGRDICEEGIGIFCWRHLEPGLLAWLRLPSRDEQEPWVRARVRHSTAATGGYYTGVTFLVEHKE